MIVRAYEKKDLEAMIQIWNEVVEEGIAFPQEELLNNVTGAEPEYMFFSKVAVTP